MSCRSRVSSIPYLFRPPSFSFSPFLPPVASRFRGRAAAQRQILISLHLLSRLAMVAFRQVFSKKQAGFGDVLEWLEREVHEVSSSKGKGWTGRSLLLQAARGVA